MSTSDKTVVRAMQIITNEPVWSALQLVASSLKVNWNTSTAIRETEWLSAREAVIKESKCRGVDLLLAEIERLSHGGNE